jgi:hypothetical protein
MRRSDILIIDIAQSRCITPVGNANTARIMKHNTVEIETKRCMMEIIDLTRVEK